MITKDEILKEIDLITRDLTGKNIYRIDPLTPAERTKGTKRIAFLKDILTYLGTNPDEAYLERTRQDLEDKIARRAFVEPANASRISLPELSKLRREHEQFHGVGKLKDQLKVINYILNPKKQYA